MSKKILEFGIHCKHSLTDLNLIEVAEINYSIKSFVSFSEGGV
jgi:hypothetical protein